MHERDRASDFLLIILRDVLPLYPHLKLILMSATLEKELLGLYFPENLYLEGKRWILKQTRLPSKIYYFLVPGRNYTVHSYYLDQVLMV